MVYQNMLDGINSHIDAGESRLFLVGKYIDTFKIENGKARFSGARCGSRTGGWTRARIGRSDINALRGHHRRLAVSGMAKEATNGLEAHLRGG